MGQATLSAFKQKSLKLDSTTFSASAVDLANTSQESGDMKSSKSHPDFHFANNTSMVSFPAEDEDDQKAIGELFTPNMSMRKAHTVSAKLAQSGDDRLDFFRTISDSDMQKKYGNMEHNSPQTIKAV